MISAKRLLNYLSSKMNVMQKYSMLTLLTIPIFLSSCDKNSDREELNSQNFIPMDVGNLWVYQTVQELSDGSFVMNEEHDSVQIVGTEVIDGLTFYKFESTFPPGEFFRRNDNGSLLDETNNIYFSTSDEEGIFWTQDIKAGSEPILKIEYRMMADLEEVNVPSGVYEARITVGSVTPYESFQENYDCDKSIKRYFVPHIGEVKREEHFASSCTSLNRKLVSFDLK